MRQLPLALALIATVIAVALGRTRWAAPSLCTARVAYGILVLQAPLYFMVASDFRISLPVCEWTFGWALAKHSLTNYAHIVLFTVFFLLTYAQLRGVRRRVFWSIFATLAMGMLVELSQGVTAHGNCRMRDLIPDSAGALLGFLTVSAGTKLLQYKQQRRSAS